jgi:hypothetical protein
MSWHEDRLTNYDNLTLLSFFFYDAARCFGFPAYDFLPGPGKRDYSRPHLVSERETYFRLFLFFLTMFSFSIFFLVSLLAFSEARLSQVTTIFHYSVSVFTYTRGWPDPHNRRRFRTRA